jgi:hypothetical protein
MSEKETLKDLLQANMQRSIWLFAMQVDIEAGDFERAMVTQFEYLYWADEFYRLYDLHDKAYWDLKCAMTKETLDNVR